MFDRYRDRRSTAHLCHDPRSRKMSNPNRHFHKNHERSATLRRRTLAHSNSLSSSPPMSMSALSPQSSSASTLGDNENPSRRTLTMCREELKNTGLYLGDRSTDIRHNVEWKHFGRCDQLIAKMSPDDNKKTLEASTEEEHTQLSSSQSSTSPHAAQAVLHAIIMISADDCFLTPCGNWKGPTPTTKSFTDVKLAFRGDDPNQDTIQDDFKTVIQNAKRLMDNVATGNAQKKGFLNFIGTKEGLRFRHVLFELHDGLRSDDESSDTEEGNTELLNWPTISPEATSAKNDLLATNSHELIPLPAYDIHGKLIRPEDYKRILPGAVARVSFTLSHWYIEAKGTTGAASNTFTADVDSLRILVEAPSISSMRRRKPGTSDPGIKGSPSKKFKKM